MTWHQATVQACWRDARLAEGKEVGGLVKSPVMKLACSDLQYTRTGGHRVKDEVARCELRQPSD